MGFLVDPTRHFASAVPDTIVEPNAGRSVAAAAAAGSVAGRSSTMVASGQAAIAIDRVSRQERIVETRLAAGLREEEDMTEGLVAAPSVSQTQPCQQEFCLAANELGSFGRQVYLHAVWQEGMQDVELPFAVEVGFRAMARVGVRWQSGASIGDLLAAVAGAAGSLRLIERLWASQGGRPLSM